MKTATLLFAALREKNIGHICLFRFPDVHIVIVRPEFATLDDEERDEWLAVQIQWSTADLIRTAARARLKLFLCTESEATLHQREPRERGEGWLREFLPNATAGEYHLPEPRLAPVRTIHFHGYKGGQARSSCLGVLAKALAADGWRVLAVDVDLEAPSLDILFGRRPSRPEATLLGLEPGTDLRPDRVYLPLSGRGHIDLVACRPDGDAYDLEAVALATRHGLDPAWSAGCAQLVGEYAASAGYDIILIDHRAGLSPFNLPWVRALPGPVVAFARLDQQWMSARNYLPALFSTFSDPPGVVVSFAATGDLPEDYLDNGADQAGALLELLAAGLRARPRHELDTNVQPDEDNIPLSVEVLRDLLIAWPFDPAFRGGVLPEPTDAGLPLRESIYKLRRLLELAEHIDDPTPLGQAPHPSGARDFAAFIATPLWREIISDRSTIRYIFGRKGTGKTRLMRELANARRGEALLIDPLLNSTATSWSNGGLPLTDATLQTLQERSSANPRVFFLTLLASALACPATEPKLLRHAIEGSMAGGISVELAIARLAEALRGEYAQGQQRTFLLDGLESGFQARLLPEFVEGLFQTLLLLQTDPQWSAQIDFRVMIRPDLVFGRVQNLEQQIHGQSVNLFWDTQAIFNFALSRVPGHDWFRTQFANTVERIENSRAALTAGTLAIEKCDALLLELFPARLPRHNLQTLTFLRTYFCDGDGAIERAPRPRPRPRTGPGQPSYYPRVFDSFLREVADARRGARLGRDGRVAPDVIEAAHDAAAAEFLDSVRQELAFQLRLADDVRGNEEGIAAIITALSGEASPFVPLDLATRIALKVGEPRTLSAERIFEALRQMKDLGMFEELPAASGRWRVGRLFKTALGMKQARRT